MRSSTTIGIYFSLQVWWGTLGDNAHKRLCNTCLSASYFGDLVKKETGRRAQEYIQEKVIDVAKERIFEKSKSIGQIAYELGFKYPQHFTRLFKQRVGHSPNEYRGMARL